MHATLGRKSEVSQFEPLFNLVLIELLEPGQTASGIAIPDGSDVELPRGRVVKVGPGSRNPDGTYIPICVQPGDIVFTGFAYSKPMAIKLDGKKYALAEEQTLQAKFSS